MGWTEHEIIVVTTWSEDLLKHAHDRAVEIFGTSQVSAPMTSVINGFVTFFVGPDGSKEGWPEAEDGRLRRDAFIEWLNSRRYSDMSSALSWAEVVYGTDSLPKVARHTLDPVE